jgi:hypothetical protein
MLATIVLLCALPQSVEVAKSMERVPVAVAEATKEVAESLPLPSMPTPKANSDAAGLADAAIAPATASSSAAGGVPVQPPVVAMPIQPMKPVYTRPRETQGQRVAWYALAATGHGAAAFDAWSTRRAVAGGYGTESNPLLRPFAHSGAMYAATQVSPFVMDFLGKRMMVSQNRWVRKMWWLPQAAGSGFSIAAGVHNVGVVK